MLISNIHKAKTQLSKLIAHVMEGNEVIIAKAGKPVVKIVIYKPALKKRKPGMLKRKITIAKDFDELPKEILDSFYKK